MIVFDLRCGADHVFEAWFSTGDDYAAQRERGLVRCPVCQSDAIEKAPTLTNVGRKANSRTESGAPTRTDAAEAARLAGIKAQLAALAEMQSKIEASSDYVGDRFPAEARAMHYGDKSARAIHGEATRQQVAELAEEGIPVAPLPFPSRRRADA